MSKIEKVTFAIDTEDKEALIKLARVSNCNKSEYIRGLIREKHALLRAEISDLDKLEDSYREKTKPIREAIAEEEQRDELDLKSVGAEKANYIDDNEEINIEF